MNILLIGDVFSKPGREVLKQKLPTIIDENEIDFVIVNGENISHGSGINKEHFNFLKELKIDVITSGNHIFKNKETIDFIGDNPNLLRPLNMNSFLPGNGTILVEKNNIKIRVTNLMGKNFMDHVNNPYEAMDNLLKSDNSDIHIVDFHAEATAEKLAFAWNYDGKISVIVGTHTHIPTDDAQILPKGTAYVTDLGMTGPINSIIGVNPSEVILKEKTGLPVRFVPSENKGVLNGVIVKFNNNKVIEVVRIKAM